MPDILPIPYSFLFALSSFSFSHSRCPCPNPFLDQFKCSLPHPACVHCLPSFTVSVLFSSVSVVLFYVAWAPLGLLLPGRYEVGSLCIPRACPLSCFSGHRMVGVKQKGFSQLCACSLGKGHQLLSLVTPVPLPPFRYLPLHGISALKMPKIQYPKCD